MKARASTPAFAILLACAISAVAQNPVQLDGKPALTISNDKLTLGVRTDGGAMVRMVLNDDPAAVNAMHAGLGHFVCVDGFGPVSPEERTAGLPGHGEAHLVKWELVSSEKTNVARGVNTTTVSFSATLPIVQEKFHRTIRLVDGENVVYVESELENLLGFDRPINWGEHATIGSPFLELGKTIVEMSATRAMTRSHQSQSEAPHRLASFRPFTWPMAPALNGASIDVRPTPTEVPIGDHTASLMDPARRLVFVTAFNANKHLLLGYVFRREEYPWTQLWESYPADDARIARGLEFATQPFDLPRREVIQTGSLFDTPTYRWLPAKSKIGSAFLMFYTRTPDGFRKVDDVVLDSGRLTVEDRTSGVKIVLTASRPL
jgi:hypothetical protein